MLHRGKYQINTKISFISRQPTLIFQQNWNPTLNIEMQAAQIHSMSPLIPVSQGPKNVRSQHLNSVCLSLSFHFDQHLQPAAGADPESQGCFLRLSGERATRFPFHYVGFQSATSLMSLQRA